VDPGLLQDSSFPSNVDGFRLATFADDEGLNHAHTCKRLRSREAHTFIATLVHQVSTANIALRAIKFHYGWNFVALEVLHLHRAIRVKGAIGQHFCWRVIFDDGPQCGRGVWFVGDVGLHQLQGALILPLEVLLDLFAIVLPQSDLVLGLTAACTCREGVVTRDVSIGTLLANIEVQHPIVMEVAIKTWVGLTNDGIVDDNVVTGHLPRTAQF